MGGGGVLAEASEVLLDEGVSPERRNATTRSGWNASRATSSSTSPDWAS